MYRRIIVYVYFAALICSVSVAEQDRVRVFNTDESRLDFTNLLSSLVKLNEQRINVIQKMNLLQDYGQVREVLRSSDLRNRISGGDNTKNLLIFIVSNNHSEPSRSSISFVDSVDSYYDNVKQIVDPETRRSFLTQDKLTSVENKFGMMKQYNNADNYKIPIVYRDEFKLNSDRYSFERSGYSKRRQNNVKRRKSERETKSHGNRRAKHNRYRIGLKSTITRHTRISQEKSEPAGSPDEYRQRTGKQTTNIDYEIERLKEKAKSRIIHRDTEAITVQSDIDEAIIEEDNNQFLKQMKKQKIYETQGKTRPSKTNIQISHKFGDKRKNNEYYKPTEMPASGAVIEDTDNNDKLLEQHHNKHEHHKVPAVPEAKYKQEYSVRTERYPEPTRNIPITKLLITDRQDVLKNTPNQPLSRDYHPIRTTFQMHENPHNFMSTPPVKPFRQNPKKEIGFDGNQVKYVGQQVTRDPYKNFSVIDIDIREKPNEPNIKKGPIESSIGFLMPEVTLSKQDLKSIRERLKSAKSHSKPKNAFSENHHELTLAPIFSKINKEGQEAEIKMSGKKDKLKGKHEKHESNEDFSRAVIHITSSNDKPDSTANKQGRKHHEHALLAALRQNSREESRKSWQRCLGKKALKLCQKACITATKNGCRRVKCTSKSKKDLKKECKTSCKATFKQTDKSRSEREGSSGESRSYR